MNGAVPVKTANCGFLTTLVIGDVEFHLVINGKKIVWTLKNCLHALDVPINLISVGALQEHHMPVIFLSRKQQLCSLAHIHNSADCLLMLRSYVNYHY
jgi:hypothetical protein